MAIFCRVTGHSHQSVLVEQTLRERLALRLFEERQRHGISQESLAENAGLHRTYVGAIERGAANASLETVEKLALALDVSPCALICSDTVVRNG